jgi:4-amino-4-deoxy-L-arabinose transferase-like glycosyltransferase
MCPKGDDVLGLGRVRSVGVVVSLLALGQIALLMVEPLTRADGTFAQRAGLAVLVPDSALYLSPQSLGDVFTLPWTRWAYPLLLTLGGASAESALAAVIINALALLTGGYVIHRVTEAFSGRTAALTAAAIVVANPMTAQWVRIVSTEAVFFGTIAIITGLSTRILEGTARGFVKVMLLPMALLAALTRPNGFLVATAALIVVAATRRRGTQRRAAISVALASALVLLPVAYRVTGPPAEGSITQQLYAGVVVEGTEHDRMTIAMPEPLNLDDETLVAAGRYVLAHPFAAVRLAAARLVMETVQVRRHYPTIVNAAFGFAMLLLAAAVASGWGDERARRPRVVFFVIGTPLMLLTMAPFAVPESRYGWAYLVPLAPVAGIGVDRWVTRGRLALARKSASKLGTPGRFSDE